MMNSFDKNLNPYQQIMLISAAAVSRRLEFLVRCRVYPPSIDFHISLLIIIACNSPSILGLPQRLVRRSENSTQRILHNFGLAHHNNPTYGVGNYTPPHSIRFLC
jgi:hypothetical protein